MLTPAQSAIVTETLRVSLAAAAGDVDEQRLVSLARAAAALAPPVVEDPHPAWPAVGASVVRDLEVGPEDTAAAMGHPDAAVQVLGSPRLALWFELVTCDLLPPPAAGLTHVGAGILVAPPRSRRRGGDRHRRVHGRVGVRPPGGLHVPGGRR